MRFNTIIVFAFSGVPSLIGAVDSNCTAEDFLAILQTVPLDEILCISNTTSDSWVSTCFEGVNDTCADSVDSDVNDFVTSTCGALNVINSTLPCKAVSLGMSLAHNAPGGSEYCSLDDAEEITNINMTTVTTCAAGNVTASFGCWIDALLTMNVTTPCKGCYDEGRSGLDYFCGGPGPCGTPGYDDDCAACVNAYLGEGTTYCLGAPVTTTTTTTTTTSTTSTSTKFAAVPAALHITAVLVLAAAFISL